MPNGVYEVNQTGGVKACGGSRCYDLYGYMCAIGNVRMTHERETWSDDDLVVPRVFSHVQLVEVVDGKLTLQGASDDTNVNDNKGCSSISSLTITPVPIPHEMPESWLPAQTSPWMQIELEEPKEVGLVTIYNQDIQHCSAYWLYIGNKCRPMNPDNRPLHVFHGLQDYAGFTVRVSDEPCSEAEGCSGAVCGSNSTAGSEHSVFCNGVVGKYVSVTLPGKNRVLSLYSMEAYTTNPTLLDADNNHICYGLVHMSADTINNEYTISYDPEHPVFHSTCYQRAEGVEWIPLGPTPPIATWRYNGKCVDCEAYHKNLDLVDFGVPSWPMSSEYCFDCDAHVPPDSSVLPTYAGSQCRSSPQQACLDLGYETGFCERRLYMPWRENAPADIVTLEECHLLARNDMNCSNVYYHDGYLQRCFCVLEHECCGEEAGCTVETNSNRDIYEIDMGAPNSNCTGLNGLLSPDQTMCCHPDCVNDVGDNVCGTESCQDSNTPAMCCKTGLLKECYEHTFPWLY